MRRLAPAAVVTAALITGCGVFMSEVDQVRDPLTPDEARAQVIATARELKTLLGIPVLGALAGLSSCNDQGEAPFRGRGAVHYPLARSREEALTETVGFLKTLEGAGWTILPPDYKGGQSVSAERNGVRVIFEVQGGGNQARGITVLGQCRDVTTTKATQGKMEPIPGL